LRPTLAAANIGPHEGPAIEGAYCKRGAKPSVLERTLASGQIASFFLVDAWCLGVKDAFFRVMSRLTFEEQIGKSRQERALVEVDPSVARKMLHAAAAYAGSFSLDTRAKRAGAGKFNYRVAADDFA
jgi:hypothetical protein